MTRTSLVEQYNNRDVVAQIYRLISLVESSTITSVETERTGDNVTLVLHMFDGTVQRFQFEADGIRNITTTQSGSTETVNILMDSGRTFSFSFNIAIAGMTTDTAQNVTATKTFTAPQVFRGGITGPLQVNGTTVIDGEVQVSNGHSIAVAGDVECANAVNADAVNTVQAEIGGMAIEPNGNRTSLTNPSGIEIESALYLDSILTANRGCTFNSNVSIIDTDVGLTGTNAVNSNRLNRELASYVPMVRTSGNQSITGYKTFIAPITRSSVLYNSSYVHNVTDFNSREGVADGVFKTIPEIVVNDMNNERVFQIQYVKASTYTGLNIILDNTVGQTGTLSFRIDENGVTRLYLTGPNGTKEVASI